MTLRKEFKYVAMLVRQSRELQMPRLSQSALADKLNKSRQSISHIERGLRDIPDELIEEFAKALGVDFNKIIEVKRRDSDEYFTALQGEYGDRCKRAIKENISAVLGNSADNIKDN